MSVHLISRAMSLYLLQVLVLFGVVDCIFGRRFGDDDFYPQSPYFERKQYFDNQVKEALEKLSNAPSPQWVENWPNPDVKLGQVSGVTINTAGQVLVFHRGPNIWDATTFTSRNVYSYIGNPPIDEPTVLVFNDTGELVDKWGENLFYMPHGITVDGADNVWVTDVALHQVFKFAAGDRKKPALVLGEKFVPQNDDSHFCKPTAVAVLPGGEFFVSDGYCNARIVKYAPDGTKMLQWGTDTGTVSNPYYFSVPHALTLAPEHGAVCVADREHGRVGCYTTDNGTYVTSFRNQWLIGSRLFSVAYSPVQGGRLYVVNGPSMLQSPVRGYVIDFETGRMLSTFGPGGDLSNPHDIAVSEDGSKIFVAEIKPFRMFRFEDRSVVNASAPAAGVGVGAGAPSRRESAAPPATNHAPAKPTATSEVSSNPVTGEPGWASWRGAAGGAAGAAGGALVLGAALALFSARNRGRKSVPRRRWEYGGTAGEFKLRRLLQRRRFTRVHSDDSEDEPHPMLPADGASVNHASA